MEREKTETIDVEMAREKIAAGDMQAVDSRSEEDWLDAHIPGSVHAPGGDDSAFGDIRMKSVVVVGDGDEAEATLCEQLRESDFEVKTLEGGFKAWSKEDGTVQPSDDPDPDVPVDSDDGRIEGTDVEGAQRA